MEYKKNGGIDKKAKNKYEEVGWEHDIYKSIWRMLSKKSRTSIKKLWQDFDKDYKKYGRQDVVEAPSNININNSA